MTTALDEERRKRRKRVALTLLAVVLVLLVVTMIWWGNLADADVEKGPVAPAEAVTDSADDPRVGQAE